MRRRPPSFPLVVGGMGSFLLAGLVDGGALGDAVVVALPYDVCVWGEGQQAFDSFPGELAF